MTDNPQAQDVQQALLNVYDLVYWAQIGIETAQRGKTVPIPSYLGDTIRRCLEAQLAAPVNSVPDWQPIETAPKDATRFLACADASYILPIYWRNDQGWARDAYSPLWENITHWMPLPQAPKPEKT